MVPSHPVISADKYDAVIFDLDGVITRTARVHARAWKQAFDAYLERRSRREGGQHAPFDEVTDYLRYVDGKPRYDGVSSFLESRGIILPFGQPTDSPSEETVCGIGNGKNHLYLELLRRDGAQVYEHGVDLVRRARAAGLRTAVISASRNCVAVLESVDALQLFDAKIDGNDAERQGLAGKPAPDVFLAAAEMLHVAPHRAVVVEDALAGVEAGRAGGFALVIGVDRAGQREALLEHGADVVVDDLGMVEVRRVETAGGPELPSALSHPRDIVARLQARRLAVFLDYDGTLTPIVDRPELADLDAECRAAVRHLATLCTVAVVSGRDLDDVRKRVALPGLHYAGSHGFDISGPAGLRHAHPQGVEALPRLDVAERRLRDALRQIDGVLIERKRFSIAVHFRLVAPDEVPTVEATVDHELRLAPGLRKGRGKKVVELRPDVDWDKGSALCWLLEALGLEREGVLPVYVGDDVTDEDAFRTLAARGDGIGIVVLDEPRPTAADYCLRDPAEVRCFIEELASELEAAT